MENASKALLMAAGVLIGLLILSLAVYLFATFGSSSAQMHKQIEADRLNEFNSQFTSYEGKSDLTIYDVVTVANLAKENNTYYDLETEGQKDNNFYISVCIGTSSIEKDDMQEKINNDINDMKVVKDRSGKIIDKRLPTYTCKVNINSNTGRVDKVVFTKNNT